jgi:hypothetical protein
MTIENFNEKYKNYLEEGHYGLSLGDDEFIEWLDGQFEKFITYPGFKFTQNNPNSNSQIMIPFAYNVSATICNNNGYK